MKKKFAFFFLIIILAGCSQPKFNIDKRQNDIDSIIETIIESDSLNVQKNNNQNNKVVQFLKKFKITNPKAEDILPPNIDERKLSWIFDFSSKNGFSKKDSVYLLSQNTNKDSIEISENLKTKYNYSSTSKILNDRNKGERFQYYRFSIPVFSEDNKTAYIEYDYHSEGYFGQGMAFILKKEDNKWKITESGGTWIN